MKKAAFIGTGNMGGALARTACGAIGRDQVVVANRTLAKAEALAAELGCGLAKCNEDAVREAEFIFLGVKPHLMRPLLDTLAPVLADRHAAGEDKVLVSMAAGVRIEDMRLHLKDAGYDVPVLRIMLNTCVAIGLGMTALCAEEWVDESVLEEAEKILVVTGKVDRVPESLFDQFSALVGCGPAFVYPFIEALADGAVATGLPRQQALEYAARTVLGAAAMVLDSGKHPGQLKDEVCSPGGSTIAGVAALERAGFRAAAIDAVLAAWKRNGELGK